MKRRSMKYLLVFVLLAAVVWLGSDTLRNQGRSPASLDTAIEPELKTGWKVSRPPELPGPYRRGENPLLVPRGGIGSVTFGPGEGGRVKLPVRDDADQMVVPLTAADGAVTFVVLER